MDEIPLERPGRPATPFERLGGRDALHRIIDDFYTRIDADPELRPIFPEDLVPGRQKQKLFLEQWLGGEPLYERAHGPPMMRRRHLPFAITVPAAERWLVHFGAALDAYGTDANLAGGDHDRAAPGGDADGEHDGGGGPAGSASLAIYQFDRS